MKKEDTMHIIIPSSSEYVPYLGVLIASILINKHKEDQLFFHILSEDITEWNKKQLMELKYLGEYEIEFLKMNPKDIEDVPVCQAFFINNLANYKLKISSIFKHLKRVLVLEVDMIVQSSLRELFNLFPSGGGGYLSQPKTLGARNSRNVLIFQKHTAIVIPECFCVI